MLIRKCQKSWPELGKMTSAEFKAPKIFIILTHRIHLHTHTSDTQNAIHRPTILLCDAQSERFFRLEEVFEKVPSPRGGFDAVDGQPRRRRWCRHRFHRGNLYPARAGDEARQRGFLVSLYACTHDVALFFSFRVVSWALSSIPIDVLIAGCFFVHF